MYIKGINVELFARAAGSKSSLESDWKMNSTDLHSDTCTQAL
jgi:hypothetical protein